MDALGRVELGTHLDLLAYLAEVPAEALLRIALPIFLPIHHRPLGYLERSLEARPSFHDD